MDRHFTNGDLVRLYIMLSQLLLIVRMASLVKCRERQVQKRKQSPLVSFRNKLCKICYASHVQSVIHFDHNSSDHPSTAFHSPGETEFNPQ